MMVVALVPALQAVDGPVAEAGKSAGGATSGIFDAATADYLYAELGDGIPSAVADATPLRSKVSIVTYFTTAMIPLLLVRRRRRRG